MPVPDIALDRKAMLLMHFRFRYFCGLAIVLELAFGLPAHSQVMPTTITGSFVEDDNQYQYSFDVTTAGTVSLYTTSYAGGANTNGSTSASGGFDPILTLFDGNGNYIDANDDDENSPIDPTSDNGFDARLQGDLDTGFYTVVVTEYDNFASGSTLANGFSEDGHGNFTQKYADPLNPAQAPFLDVGGNKRTGSFAFNITNGALPVAPEPSPSATLWFGLLGITCLMRKAHKRRTI